jgi:SpoVK/Ycf46/Vps4 family AAA+-type ATPase
MLALLGSPLLFLLSPANVHDAPFARPLLDGADPGKAQMEMLLSGLIEPRVSVDQVILPEAVITAVLQTLDQAIPAIQELLFQTWGFDAILEKGRGIGMLFVGPPGTGKTMLAEALAKRLGYQFWNIGSGNLNGMFVGDFEKAVSAAFKKARKTRQEWLDWDKLRQDADAPQMVTVGSGDDLEEVDRETVGLPKEEIELPPEPPKGIILLFDEVDSIVAARDNKSTDGPSWSMGPLAAGQINHFLREMEEFDGVVIFPTNRVTTLDEAFERRISLIQEFPFPDATIREQIWKSKIPSQAPLADDIDWAALAKHEIAGGHIKNAVMHAARMAALRRPRRSHRCISWPDSRRFSKAHELSRAKRKKRARKPPQSNSGAGIANGLAASSLAPTSPS